MLALPARIEAIPDGTTGGPKNTSAWTPSTTSRPDIKFDSGDSNEVALFISCRLHFSLSSFLIILFGLSQSHMSCLSYFLLRATEVQYH